MCIASHNECGIFVEKDRYSRRDLWRRFFGCCVRAFNIALHSLGRSILQSSFEARISRGFIVCSRLLVLVHALCWVLSLSCVSYYPLIVAIGPFPPPFLMFCVLMLIDSQQKARVIPSNGRMCNTNHYAKYVLENKLL